MARRYPHPLQFPAVANPYRAPLNDDDGGDDDGDKPRRRRRDDEDEDDETFLEMKVAA